MQGRRSHRIIGGDIKKRLGTWETKKLELFFVKLHIIFALKYNKQQLLNYNTSKILGGTLPWMSPFINIGGHVPPVP